MTFDEWVEKRVVVDEETRGGKPCFAGSRLSIEHIVNLTEKYVTYGYLFDNYSFLTTEDIRFAVMYNNSSTNGKNNEQY